jgi:hypothetical protein
MMNTFFARIVMVNTYSFFPPTHCRYLPGETSFLPKDEEQHSRAEIKDKRKMLLENWVFSQLSYLAIFVMLICITEREAMVTDPLNFNVFSILFEVIRQVSEIKCDLQVALAIIITNFWFW